MKKPDLRQMAFCLLDMEHVQQNMKKVKTSPLQQTGFSTETNRSLYIDACKRQIRKYRNRLKRLGYYATKTLF